VNSDANLTDAIDPGSSPALTSFGLCGGCERLLRCRLGFEFERLLDDGSVETSVTCTAEHEGGPSVAHGGWTAAAFDELLGHVPKLHGILAVTGQLSVTYLKPVPIDRPLIGRSWVERREGSRWYVKGELTLAATGAVLSLGEAVMVKRDPLHFERHREWLAQQDLASGTSRRGQERE
jgi:acyl-coenzyme A thioesterase PaaI-like protein